MKDLQKRPIHIKRNLQTSPIFTTKKQNTKMVWHLCDIMTYMSKETYIYAKRPTKSTNIWETDKRDLYTCKGTYERALYLQKKKDQLQHGLIPAWHDDIFVKRDLHIRKQINKRDLFMQTETYKKVLCTERNIQTSPIFTKKKKTTTTWPDTCATWWYICQKRPTYTQRDRQKRPIYGKRDLQKRPIHMKRNLHKSPLFTTTKINTEMVSKEIDKRDLSMRKETYKRDLYTWKETYTRTLHLQQQRPTPRWSDACVTWRYICQKRPKYM